MRVLARVEHLYTGVIDTDTYRWCVLIYPELEKWIKHTNFITSFTTQCAVFKVDISILWKNVNFSSDTDSTALKCRQWAMIMSHRLHEFAWKQLVPISVVTESEFASESANFFPVRPSPNPRIFGDQKWRFWNVCSKIFSPHFSNLYHQNPVRMALTPFSLTHRYTTTTT